MPFEAGAFELIFLAMVALIVVGPKDLPILLRKVGQWTAKMRGLAAEFRASFDEMARQSELDELRKEVEALRTGQLAAEAKTDVETHAADVDHHLSDNYWGASSHADTATLYSDVSVAAEGDETAALPPPGSATPPLPTLRRKSLTGEAEPKDAPTKAARKPRAKIATAPAPAETAGAAPLDPVGEASAAPKPAPRRKPTKLAAAKTPDTNAPAPEAAEI